MRRGNRRTMRVKRTKRTKINRRTKRTKRLSRKTRRSRRMRGGLGFSGGTGRGGVEDTIQIGNERFRPPNEYEKGDGERIVGSRVCVEMEKDSEFWDTGKIISFEKKMQGASSHTIKFDYEDQPIAGVKLMRGRTTTDPENKNWKTLSLEYTPEQLSKTTINDPEAGIWQLDPATPGYSPLSGFARDAAAKAWEEKTKTEEWKRQAALDRAQKAIDNMEAARGVPTPRANKKKSSN